MKRLRDVRGQVIGQDQVEIPQVIIGGTGMDFNGCLRTVGGREGKALNPARGGQGG